MEGVQKQVSVAFRLSHLYFSLFDPAAVMELLQYIVTYWVNRIIGWTFLHELHKTLSLALADSERFFLLLNRKYSRAVSVWVVIQSVHFDS